MLDTIIGGLIFAVSIAAIIVAICGYYTETAREIAEEAAERKYRRELHAWQQTARHPRVHISVIDGQEITIEGGHEK